MIGLLNTAVAATIVVDQSGGGDYADLADAVEAAADGDTVMIRAGSYSASGLSFSNLTVIGESRRSVWIQNLEPDATVARTGSSTPAWVEAITFVDHPAASGDGDGLHVEGTVVDCAFYGFENAISTSDVTVIDSLFVDNESGIGFGYFDYIRVENSVFLGGTYGTDDHTAYSGGGTMEVVHSTFVGQEYFHLVTKAETLVIEDNVFVGSGWTALAHVEQPDKSTFRNNLYWDQPWEEAWSKDAAYSWGDDYLEEDPLFAAWSDDGDWDNDDFRLLHGSPAVDAAVTDDLATDLDGTSRPQDGDADGKAVSDLGAYELVIDVDADGHPDTAFGGEDCDDEDDAVHPDAEDTCGDGIDQDCDGVDAACDSGDTALDTAPPVDSADTARPADTEGDTASHTGARPDDTAGPPSDTGGDTGKVCGCGSTPAPGLLFPLPLVAVWRRRRMTWS